MAWNDHGDRLLLLLSMAALGCPTGGGGDDMGDETSGSTSGSGPTTSPNPETSADTTEGPQSTTSGTTMGAESDTSSGGSTTTENDSTSESSTGETSTGESSTGETSTSVEPPSPFVEACVAGNGAYFDCSKYSYTEEQLLQQCTFYEGYLEQYYGVECVGLQTDFLACLSELSCKEFENVPPFGDLCAEEALAGNEGCPELFPFCAGGGGSGGAGGCTLMATECLDGNAYSVDCDAETCTCMISDVAGATFDSPGAESCTDKGFAEMAEMACGFPAGVFL